MSGRLLQPFAYYGGKARMSDWIFRRLPQGDHFVDLFCGSAVIGLNCGFRSVTINDMNGRLVNFFRVLRDREDELIGAIELTPYAREEHALARETADDPLEDARRMFVLCHQSFGSIAHETSTWKRSKLHGRISAKSVVNKSRTLPQIAERLREIQIEQGCGIRLAEEYGRPGNVLFADPPYEHSRRASCGSYQHEMEDSDHIRLAEALNSANCAAAVCGFRSDLYDDLYAGWTLHEADFINKTGTLRGKRSARRECLWVREGT